MYVSSGNFASMYQTCEDGGVNVSHCVSSKTSVPQPGSSVSVVWLWVKLWDIILKWEMYYKAAARPHAV